MLVWAPPDLGGSNTYIKHISNKLTANLIILTMTLAPMTEKPLQEVASVASHGVVLLSLLCWVGLSIYKL